MDNNKVALYKMTKNFMLLVWGWIIIKDALL